jgi:hypothetical protein
MDEKRRRYVPSHDGASLWGVFCTRLARVNFLNRTSCLLHGLRFPSLANISICCPWIQIIAYYQVSGATETYTVAWPSLTREDLQVEESPSHISPIMNNLLLIIWRARDIWRWPFQKKKKKTFPWALIPRRSCLLWDIRETYKRANLLDLLDLLV